MIHTALGSRVKSVEWYSEATLLASVVVDHRVGDYHVVLPAATLEADGGLAEVVAAAKEIRHRQKAPAGRTTG